MQSPIVTDIKMSSESIPSSSPREFHPQALTELDVSLSTHPALMENIYYLKELLQNPIYEQVRLPLSQKLQPLKGSSGSVTETFVFSSHPSYQ